MHEIEDKVKKILSRELNFPIDRISLDSMLIDDLGMDSFAAIEVIFAIGKEFDTKITPDERSQFKKVRDIVDKIKADQT